MNICVKKIVLNNAIKLCFIFKSFSVACPKTLKSQIEINLVELSMSIKDVELDYTHLICEGGWYFNKPSKLLELFPGYKIYYFTLSPTIDQLKRQYLSRTPRSRKDINNNNDWANYEKIIWTPLLKANENNKVALKNLNMGYFEFANEDIDIKANKVMEIIEQQKEPTIFIITGPNAAGKSTLLYSLLNRFNLLDN